MYRYIRDTTHVFLEIVFNLSSQILPSGLKLLRAGVGGGNLISIFSYFLVVFAIAQEMF